MNASDINLEVVAASVLVIATVVTETEDAAVAAVNSLATVTAANITTALAEAPEPVTVAVIESSLQTNVEVIIIPAPSPPPSPPPLQPPPDMPPLALTGTSVDVSAVSMAAAAAVAVVFIVAVAFVLYKRSAKRPKHTTTNVVSSQQVGISMTVHSSASSSSADGPALPAYTPDEKAELFL